MPTKFETYPLERLSCVASSDIDYCKERNNNNDISTDENSKKIERKMTEIANSKKKISTKFKPFIGIVCTFFHALCVQTISVIVKKVWYISVCQHALVRYIGIFVFSLPLAVLCTNQILGEKRNRVLLLIIAITSTTGYIFQITAYRYLQLVQASIVTSTLPLVTALTARILLKEPFGIVQTVSLIITVCAILLSIRLPDVLFGNKNFHFENHHLIGYATAIGFVLCLALSTVAMRKLKGTHFSIILLYTGAVGIVETATVNVSMFSFVAADCGWDHVLHALLAIITFIGFMMMTVAIQHEPAGLFAVQKSSFELLVIIVFQIMIFQKYPDLYAAAGACLVLISLTIIGIKNWVQMMPETSEKRKRFKWILL